MSEELSRHLYLKSRPDVEDLGIEHRMASVFLEEIHELDRESEEPIYIHLKTGGGGWEDGMEIYDAIEYCKSPTVIIGHGQVCSMGTIIMQAADKRYLMPHCTFMVHYGEVFVGGHQLAVEATNTYYTKVKDMMFDIYANRCMKAKYFVDGGYTKAHVLEFLKENIKDKCDWYLSPRDAQKYGFIDSVITKRSYRKYVLKK